MPKANRETQQQAASSPIGRARAIITCKCPACRKGEMFIHPYYKLNGFASMYDECPRCGQDFKIEPGFYMSASYIGYVFYVVIIMAITFTSFYFLPALDDLILIFGIIALTLVLIPLDFRLARAVCLHFLGSIRYDPDLIYNEDGFFVSNKGLLRRGKPRLPRPNSD